MAADFVQSQLHNLYLPWWGIGAAYCCLVILLDTILFLARGGRALVGELFREPIHLFWVAAMCGVVPALYVVNWEAISQAIFTLQVVGPGRVGRDCSSEHLAVHDVSE